MKKLKRPIKILVYEKENYIRVKDCGISIFCLLVDGSFFTEFKEYKDPFIKVVDCLVWFKKEEEYGKKWGHPKEALKRYREAIVFYTKIMEENNKEIC